jgi:hypothetical protein
VDETGQDTKGAFFIVSVVITEDDRDVLLSRLERVEQISGKGKLDWNNTEDAVRVRYIRSILNIPAFKRKLNFSVSRNTTAYLDATASSIAKSIQAYTPRDYRAAIFIDGLRSKRETQELTHQLRRLGVRVKKVRGVRKREDNALVRLADALCGFTRAAMLGRPSR